jgi:hypothetical protein
MILRSQPLCRPAQMILAKRVEARGELRRSLPQPGACGSRMLRGLLAAEGCKIGRRHVRTLMRRMRIEALYRARSKYG